MAIETRLTPAYVEHYTTAGLWQNKLILDFFDAAVTRNPDKEVVVDRWRRLTYGQLGEMVDRAACGLLERGMGPRDIMVLQLPNWHQFVVFHLALTRIGAITANIPHIFRQREVGYVLGLTEAKALAVPAEFRGFDYRAMIAQLRPDLPNLRHVFVVGGDAPPDMLSYDEFIAEPWEQRRDRASLPKLRPAPNEVTQIGFTSGTTGEPKGAMHTSNTLGAQCATQQNANQMDEHDVVYMASPVGHHTAFAFGVRLPLYLGAKTVLQEQWVPAEGLATMAAERATYTVSATTFLQDIVYAPELERYEHLPALRTFICGGAPVPSKLLADAKERLPHTFVGAGWGMTENGAVTLVPHDSPPSKVIDSDGRPWPGSEVRIVGPDGREVPRGVDGELEVRSAQQSVGYFRRPDRDAEVYREDGFFRTGDQARMDADGYIRITGRIKDLIIRGGENIAPLEIENILFTHPKIAAVSVIGMSDPRLGERICAYVATKRGETVTFEEVVEWVARAGVAKAKRPERVELVDSLPTTPAGKVQKYVLREWIEAKLAAERTQVPAT